MLLREHLASGGLVELQSGLLVMKCAEGKPMPAEWQEKHQSEIVQSIAKLINIPVFQYLGFSTGRFAGGRYSGVKLDYLNLLDWTSPFAIFNAELAHKRSTRSHKAGTPYKGNKFLVGDRSAFKMMWLKMGLSLPQNNSKYFECMGRLKPIFITAQGKQRHSVSKTVKLDNGTIEPVHVTRNTLCGLLGIDITTNLLPNIYQNTTNLLPTVTTKESHQSATIKGLEDDLNCGVDNYGLSVKGERVKGVNETFNNELIREQSIKEQSTKEWLSSYGEVDFNINN
ncbi:hypothetical protein KO525_18665 [Psychrosphaera sp. B3R10]|uniref:hypothetical protein n=1 Tax=unclassified Psychrosphaera TaxID=2641570 RepID=UPI001C084EDD|nr:MULTISPECIES: hypothetical protein [unclassified Psychrosphaera]MBU2883012.1 hypothetical protein [Psychrosphaera sp. I2R16]MBU2991409.1 hypothetical protein [Psychrosphaera sp. B3R10]